MPAKLNAVNEELLPALSPADIIMLEDAALLKAVIEPSFFAILACPSCGIPGLITLPQYGGVVPVICGSNLCSCRFRIAEHRRLEFLPVN